MQQLLEKLSRYWQLRAAVVSVGVVLIAYALVMPVHSNELVGGVNSDQALVTQVTPVNSGSNSAVARDGITPRTFSAVPAALPVEGWLARNPEAAAQFNFAARLYQDGNLPVDFSESIRQLRTSAEQGSPVAEFLLGNAYESGMGVHKDMAETLTWYAKAAAASRALDAASGAAGSASQPAPKNFAEAFEAYRKAAEDGDKYAQLYLGLSYELGQNVSKSPVEAANWYRKAAGQGSQSAENNLGVLYHMGSGIPKDDTAAASWFGKAANHGSIVGQYNLGQMYMNGQGVPRDYSKAAIWLDKAARQGSTPAQIILSTLYASGQGVTGNFPLAYMWLNLASATEPQARNSRNEIEKVVPPDEVAEGQKLTREWISQHPRTVE